MEGGAVGEAEERGKLSSRCSLRSTEERLCSQEACGESPFDLSGCGWLYGSAERASSLRSHVSTGAVAP